MVRVLSAIKSGTVFEIAASYAEADPKRSHKIFAVADGTWVVFVAAEMRGASTVGKVSDHGLLAYELGQSAFLEFFAPTMPTGLELVFPSRVFHSDDSFADVCQSVPARLEPDTTVRLPLSASAPTAKQEREVHNAQDREFRDLRNQVFAVGADPDPLQGEVDADPEDDVIAIAELAKLHVTDKTKKVRKRVVALRVVKRTRRKLLVRRRKTAVVLGTRQPQREKPLR